MAPHHARSRARRIQKNAIKGLPLAEILRLAAIVDHDSCRELQSGEIFGDTLRAHAVRVHCEKLALRKLKQVSGLATWRRACIKHSHSVANIPKRAGPLSARVLHRDLAGAKTREPFSPPRIPEQYRFLPEPLRGISAPIRVLARSSCGPSAPADPP